MVKLPPLIPGAHIIYLYVDIIGIKISYHFSSSGEPQLAGWLSKNMDDVFANGYKSVRLLLINQWKLVLLLFRLKYLRQRLLRYILFINFHFSFDDKVQKILLNFILIPYIIRLFFFKFKTKEKCQFKPIIIKPGRKLKSFFFFLAADIWNERMLHGLIKRWIVDEWQNCPAMPS